MIRNVICDCGNDTYTSTGKEWECVNCGKITAQRKNSQKSRDITTCTNLNTVLVHCTPSQKKTINSILSFEYYTFIDASILYGSVFISFKNEIGFFSSFKISIKGKERRF